MASRAALGRALVASGGTLLVLGGATTAVSSVSMAVTRFVVDRNKKKYMVACPVCHAKQKVSCDVCRGERTLRYQPAKAPQPTSTFGPQLSACAMCEGCGEQTCPNCTGSGETLPLPAGCYLGRWCVWRWVVQGVTRLLGNARRAWCQHGSAQGRWWEQAAPPRGGSSSL
ncbi:hypothetical protein V8C86DRAFT_472590 [Haematococcus lacustris]